MRLWGTRFALLLCPLLVVTATPVPAVAVPAHAVARVVADPPVPASPAPAAAPSRPTTTPHDAHLDPARSTETPTLAANLRRFDNPDGSHTLRIGTGALKAPDSAGRIGDLDLSLQTGTDGWSRPRRSPTPTAFAARAGGPVATVTLANGASLAVTAPGLSAGATPSQVPDPSGDIVRYHAALPNGTSLDLSPRSDGVESTYVVASAGAAAGLTEQLTLPAGYRARQDGDHIDVLDPQGATAAAWIGGTAGDSGTRGATSDVSLRLRRVRGHDVVASVVVDHGWLTAPDRRYPVSIDPAVVREPSSQSGYGATYVDTTDSSSHWNGSDLLLGTWDGNEVARTLISFPLSGIPAHSRIVGATMFLDEYWSSSCTPRAMEAHRITAAWSGDVSWATKPAYQDGAESSVTVASGNSAACPETWQQMDLSALVADWYYGRAADNGVLLKAADETDLLGWKRFRGANTGTAPFVDVTYESYGTNPVTVNDGDKQPPATIGAGYQSVTLTNQGSDPWPANGNYRISYHVYKPDGTFVKDGVRTLIPSTVNPGGTITLRATIEALPMGDYVLAWDMVEEGVAWFSGLGVPTVDRNYHSNAPPSVPALVSPANGLRMISLTPTLTATATDPDGPHLQYLFRICTGSDAESGSCADSGWIDASSWQVPRGTLSWGTTYYWHTWARDNSPGPYGVVSPPPAFSYVPTLPVTQAEWAYGDDPYVNYQNGVNTALGDYVSTATDVTVPTVGPTLGMARTYNSMDRDDGLGLKPGGGTYGFGKWFGVGWSSPYETNMVFDSAGNAEVTYPDGRREFLIANGDGTFQPAFGFVSAVTTVVDVEGGVTRILYYDLKHRDQSVWRYRPDGRLDSMTDAQGHRVRLSWNTDTNGNCCATVTITDQASGRSLTATFSAPATGFGRVTQMSTTSVTVAGKRQQLVWTYAYDANNELAKACDPTGACTAYAYDGPDNRLSGITQPDGDTVVTLAYDSAKRIAKVTDGVGSATAYAYGSPAAGSPSGTSATTTVTDPLGRVTRSSYNQLNQLLQHVNPDGGATGYTYDQHGFLSGFTDEDGHTTTYANDERSNVLQTQDGAGDITYLTYDATNHLSSVRDPRSASASDTTYQTTYTYDAAGNLTAQKGPAGTLTWTYSTGTEAATGGGTVPPNLPLTAIDAMGHRTTYAYDAQGDLRQRVDPTGLSTQYGYDELGRQTTRTQVSDAYPVGLTTTTAYDVAGRVTSVTQPAAVDAVTGADHQQVTTVGYDGNGNPTTVTVADADGGDTARTTRYGYDADNRRTSVTDALGNVSSTGYDAVGNVDRQADALGRVTAFGYTSDNQVSQVRLLGYVDGGGTTRDLTLETDAYDPAGRLVSRTDALGHQTRYAYDNANRLTGTALVGYHDRDGSTRDVALQSRSYDRAGDLTKLVEGGLRTTTYTYDAAARLATSAVADGLGATRTTSLTYDANGNVLSRTLTDGIRTEQLLIHYDLDQPARPDRMDEVNGSGSGDLVSTYQYDQRDLVTAAVDPRGDTTGYGYDTAGRTVSRNGPAVPVESGGSAPVSTSPTEKQGYDTFGDPAAYRDPRGAVTTAVYDALGRVLRIAYPTYTPPGGTPLNATESATYDAVGNMLTWTDRRGQNTSYGYDMRDQLVRQTDPKISGQVTAGVTSYAYDDAGNLTGTVDPVGAHRSFTYDDLGRTRTATVLVTTAGNPPTATPETTTTDYDDLGDVTYQASPLGEVTTAKYDTLGESVQATDPLGHSTAVTRDLAGRPVTVTDPLGRRATYTYDPAGRLVQTKQADASGTTLATTSRQYDPAGNLTGYTDALGHTTTYAYDAQSRLTGITQPVSASASITASFGYDEAGNQTRTTDGNGHATTTSYNAWNLPETEVVPATAAHPAAADRTWTWSYDAAGGVRTEQRPGGTTTYTYDELGRLTQRTGAAGATNTIATYGYDLAGRMTTIGGSGGTATFGYDERGLLVASSGVAGGASVAYDGDGRPVSRTDAAGTTTYGWDAAGELTSAAEPLTKTTMSFGHDAAGQLTHVGYGSGGVGRTYGYDGLGRLTSDVITTAAGGTVQKAAYGYDTAGHLTSRQLTTASGEGTDAYTYDFAGRLTSWTDPLGNLTGYTWDNAGNRVQAGAQAYTYDERNELLTGGGNTDTWAGDGSLLNETSAGVATTYRYDGLGRLTTAAQTLATGTTSSTTYAYDSLDRIVKRNQSALTYAGTDTSPVSDGTYTYSRGPDDSPLAVSDGHTPLYAALDQHGDLSMTFDTAGNAKGAYTYDPFGAVVPKISNSTTAPSPDLGYQGEWTDPATGKLLMGARWYDGHAGRFLTQDTPQPVGNPSDTNRYLYADADPLDHADPTGHQPAPPSGSSSGVDFCVWIEIFDIPVEVCLEHGDSGGGGGSSGVGSFGDGGVSGGDGGGSSFGSSGDGGVSGGVGDVSGGGGYWWTPVSSYPTGGGDQQSPLPQWYTPPTSGQRVLAPPAPSVNDGGGHTYLPPGVRSPVPGSATPPVTSVPPAASGGCHDCGSANDRQQGAMLPGPFANLPRSGGTTCDQPAQPGVPALANSCGQSPSNPGRNNPGPGGAAAAAAAIAIAIAAASATATTTGAGGAAAGAGAIAATSPAAIPLSPQEEEYRAQAQEQMLQRMDHDRQTLPSDRRPSAYCPAWDSTGNIYVGRSGTTIWHCAEHDAFEQWRTKGSPGEFRFGRAHGWRRQPGMSTKRPPGPVELPVCRNCQAIYPPHYFPGRNDYAPGGWWSLL